jgi:hypothetical protein
LILRFWLKNTGDRLSDKEIIKRDKPYEVPFKPATLDDGYILSDQKQAAFSAIAESVTVCAPEMVNHAILRVEIVDNGKVKVIYGD